MRVKWNRNLDVPVPQRAQPTPATTTKDEKRRSFLQIFKFRDRKNTNKPSKDENEKESPPSPSKTTKVRKTVTFAEQSSPQVVTCNKKGRRISNDQVDMSVFKVTRSSDTEKSVVQVPEVSPLFKKRPELDRPSGSTLDYRCGKQDITSQKMCTGKMLEIRKDVRTGGDDRFSFRYDGSGTWSSWDNVGSNRSASQTRITSNGLDKVRSDLKIKDEDTRIRSIAEEEKATTSKIPIAVNSTKEGENCSRHNGENTKIKIGYSGNEYANKLPRIKQGINECGSKISQSKIPTVEKTLSKTEKLYPDKVGNDRAMSKAILAHKNSQGETVAKKTLPDVEICDTVPFGRTRNVPKVISTDVLQFYSNGVSNNDGNTKLKDDLRITNEVGDFENDKDCKKLRTGRVLKDNHDIAGYRVFSTATELHAECVFIDDGEPTTDDDEAQKMDLFENSNRVSVATECASLTSVSEIAAGHVLVNDLGGCQGRNISACSAESAGANKKELSTETNCDISQTGDLNIERVQEPLSISEDLFDKTKTKVEVCVERKYWKEENVSSQLVPATTALNVEHVFIHDNELEDVKSDENIARDVEGVISSKEERHVADVSSHRLITSLNVEHMFTDESVCHSSELSNETASSLPIRKVEHVSVDNDVNVHSEETVNGKDVSSRGISSAVDCGDIFFIDDEQKAITTDVYKDSNAILVSEQDNDTREDLKLREAIEESPKIVYNVTDNIVVEENVEKVTVEDCEMDRDRIEKDDLPTVSDKIDGAREGEVIGIDCETSEESNAEHVFVVNELSLTGNTISQPNYCSEVSITGCQTASELNIEQIPVIENLNETNIDQNFIQISEIESNASNDISVASPNLPEKINEIENLDVSPSVPDKDTSTEAEDLKHSQELKTELVELSNTETKIENFTVQQSTDANSTSINKNDDLSVIKRHTTLDSRIRRCIKSSESDPATMSTKALSYSSVILPIKITLQFNNNLKATIDPRCFLNNGRKLMVGTRHGECVKRVVIASENSSSRTRIPSYNQVSGSRDKNSPEIGYIKLTGLDGGRFLVQLNRLSRDVDRSPVNFEELVSCQKSPSLDILDLLYGKHAKQTQSSSFNKGNVQSYKQQQQQPQPPVWTTRVELAKEIQRLGTLCEARTKELTHLKMQLKHASLGFDTFVVLFQYLTDELDAFSHTRLVSELEKTKEALNIAEEHLQQYRSEFEELKMKHSMEFSELTDKLSKTYQEVIEELTCKHTTEVQELKFFHEQQLAEMAENHMKQYQEAKEKHTMSLIDLESSHQQQLTEMKRTHAEELEEIEYNHQQARILLGNQLKELEHQCKDLKHQAKLVEEALQRDTDTKIQWISAKKADLEKEVDSLKTVLDMKRNEIHALRRENLEMKKELEKLPVAKQKIKMLQAKAEDLQALVNEKVQKERQLSCDHECLKESYEKESKVNKRLSMENEELLWKLKQTAEANFLNSLSGSPEVFEKLFSPLKSPSKQSVSLPPMFFHSVDESFNSAKETPSPNPSKNVCKKPPLSPRKCSSPIRTPSFVAATPAAPCTRRCKTETKHASPHKQKHKEYRQSTDRSKCVREKQLSDFTNSDRSASGAKSTSNIDVKYESAVQNGIHEVVEGEMFACSLEKARGCDELILQGNDETSNCKMLDFQDFNNTSELEKPRAFTFELENSIAGSTISNNGQLPINYCQHMISSYSEEESSNSSSSKNFLFDEHHFEERGSLEFNHSLIHREGWAISSPRNHAGEAMIHNSSQVSNDETAEFYTPRGSRSKPTQMHESKQNSHHQQQSFTTNVPDSNNLDTSCEDFLSEPEQTS